VEKRGPFLFCEPIVTRQVSPHSFARYEEGSLYHKPKITLVSPHVKRDFQGTLPTISRLKDYACTFQHYAEWATPLIDPEAPCFCGELPST